MAVFLCAGWSMASPLPAASAEPFCQVQLGGKIATVPCGTCEDVLAEPGMAGNVACSDSRPAVSPPPSRQGSVEQADVPGMRHDPVRGQPCGNYGKYVFGRDQNGGLYSCHYDGRSSNVWDGPLDWPLRGVQKEGTRCAGNAYAQSPDGFALSCSTLDNVWARI